MVREPRLMRLVFISTTTRSINRPSYQYLNIFSVLDLRSCPRFPVTLRPPHWRGPHWDLLRQDVAAWLQGRDRGLEQERRGEPEGRGAVPGVAGELGHDGDDGDHFHFSRSRIFSNPSCWRRISGLSWDPATSQKRGRSSTTTWGEATTRNVAFSVKFSNVFTGNWKSPHRFTL